MLWWTHLYAVGKVSFLSKANKIFLSATSTITNINKKKKSISLPSPIHLTPPPPEQSFGSLYSPELFHVAQSTP
jgi:hypothetical protein